MVITWELLNSGKSENGGWSREQLELLGVEWPGEPWWYRKVIGKVIPDADAERFVSLRNQHLNATKDSLRGSKPKNQRLRIRFDGSCSNNGTSQAKAAYGWQVHDLAPGRELASGSRRSKNAIQTNNVAEWEGLIAAIQWVRSQGLNWCHLLIQGDSRLVIQTLTRKWKAKQPHLATLRDKALSLLKGMKWDASWIPRTSNKEADTLSRS